MAVQLAKLLVGLLILTIFMMVKNLILHLLSIKVFVGLGTIIFGAVIYANEEFEGFGISLSVLLLNIVIGLLFIGFSLFGVLGAVRRNKSCIAIVLFSYLYNIQSF